MPVVVAVVESEDAVGAGLESADCELSELVGFRHALERKGGYGCVGEVAVDAHYHPLRRFESACLEHHAGDAERVDYIAGGEVHGETVEDVSLVEVADGVGKVDGVGGVGYE